jgi:glycosyltransferase involved in cell wall biosynthesis
MGKTKLMLVTTVPDTFISILNGQPGYLRGFFDVTLVSTDDGRLVEFGRLEGVKTYHIPMVRGINPFADLHSVFRMVGLLCRSKPDVVHSYTPKAGLVSMLSGWICRVPIRVHTFTGLIFPTQTGFKQRLLIWIDRLICYCATRVVPEGQGVLTDLCQYRITNKPLNVIGHGNIAGVDTGYFRPDHDDVLKAAKVLRDRLDGSRFVFCFVGRLNRDKGIRELVQAFSRLPKDVSLLLVGGDDPVASIDDETRKLIRSSVNIHSLGFMGDIRPALAASDLLVLASYREGFPNAVLQAGAMRLPVIATDIGGCNEVITPGLNGWLVQPADADALYAAMNTALALPKEALLVMGQSARQRIAERFERTEHWERMRRFYQELAN